LKQIGETIEINAGNSTYVSSQSAVVDDQTETLFFMAAYPYEGESTRSVGEAVIVAYDVANKQQSTVSSRTVGNGVDLTHAELQLDEDSQLLYAISQSEVIIIDAVTGDRVMRELVTPESP